MTKSNTKGKTNPFGGRGGCKKMVLSGIFNFAVWYFQRKKSWQRCKAAVRVPESNKQSWKKFLFEKFL